MLHQLSKHLEVRQYYSAARRIFNSLLGDWKFDETLSQVFGILLLKLINNSWSGQPINITHSRQVDGSWYPMKHQIKIFRVLISVQNRVWSQIKHLHFNGFFNITLHFCVQCSTKQDKPFICFSEPLMKHSHSFLIYYIKKVLTIILLMFFLSRHSKGQSCS